MKEFKHFPRNRFAQKPIPSRVELYWGDKFLCFLRILLFNYNRIFSPYFASLRLFSFSSNPWKKKSPNYFSHSIWFILCDSTHTESINYPRRHPPVIHHCFSFHHLCPWIKKILFIRDLPHKFSANKWHILQVHNKLFHHSYSFVCSSTF